MKPTLYLFVGYPGSGKTTVARLITQQTGGVHLWADFERHVMFDETSHSPAESKILYDHLNRVADELLEQGKCVVYDTNFNFRKDRDRLRSMATKHGAETIVVWVTTNRALAQKRATEESENKDTRIWGNMPMNAFTRMSDNLQEPDSDEHVLKIDGAHVDAASIKTALEL
ncbi:ATP-binding protein [Aeromicrobium sp.]|nr:ATP-binding protein [Candidatus Saccharibacteria bacterium]